MENIKWITGASSGIGKELAKKFYQQDYFTALTSRNISSKYFDFVDETSQRVIFSNADVSDYNSILSAYELISKSGFVDLLINNAGTTSFTLAEDDSPELINKIISTNLLGAIYSIKCVLPEMIKRKRGTIINILSVAAEKIFTKSSAYAASKAGLLAYSNALREEVRKYNIKVINVLPGATATPIWPSSALEKFSFRMMKPEDLAELIFNIAVNDKNIVAEEITIRPIQGDL